MADDRNTKLVLVFFIFLLLITYPVLGIFDRLPNTQDGPAQYFYLFFVWLALIFAVGLIVKKKKG